MSQSSMNVGNVSAPQFRSAMNAALQALASTSSGSAAPSTTYANQLWYDTTANILKMRNEANSAWINLLYIAQTGAVRVLDDTQVVNTSGTQTGLLGDQTTATWQAGTGTVESLVSPAKIKAAIDARRFTSAPQSVASGVAVAHGLGQVPFGYSVRLRCATSEYGYSVDDEIDATSVNDAPGQTIGGTYCDATNLGWRYNSTVVRIVEKNSTTLRAITPANWRLVFRAWL